MAVSSTTALGELRLLGLEVQGSTGSSLSLMAKVLFEAEGKMDSGPFVCAVRLRHRTCDGKEEFEHPSGLRAGFHEPRSIQRGPEEI